MWVTSATPTRWPVRRSGRRRGLPPGRARRARAWTSATCATTSMTTTPARPRACGRCTSAASRGRFVLASSMVVYGEGRYRCADARHLRPRDRGVRDDLAARSLRARRARGAPAPMAWAPIDGGRAARPAERLRRHEAAPGAPRAAVFGREHGVPVTALRYHNVYGPRCPATRPTPAWLDLPLGGGARRGAAGVRGRRPDPRLRARPRRGPGQRPRPHRRASPTTERSNVASGTPRTVLDLAEAACRGHGDLAPRSSAAAALGDVRHVVASPARAARACSGSRPASPSTALDGRLRRAGGAP